MTIDPSVLAAVKRAAEAATPLPWVHRSAMYDEVWGTRLVSESVEWPADAAYIVAACNAAPALIAEIERLTAQVEAVPERLWRKAIERSGHVIDGEGFMEVIAWACVQFHALAESDD